MQNRIFSFVIGMIVTLAISGQAYYYLIHQKNKKGFEVQSSYYDFLETLDLRFSDFKYKIEGAKKSKADVVLVAIDDASIREIGRWPWGRDIIAELTQNLMDYGAKSVGMDVIWSEPERGFEANDRVLGDTVKKNADRIVLGTFSDDLIKLFPYQDYCVTEAFLQSGGADLIKPNSSFVVDDTSDVYEDIRWGDLFGPLFTSIFQDTEINYLARQKKKSVAELTPFQKNFLKAKKSREIFEYCSRWLTNEDTQLKENASILQPRYHSLFKAKEGFQDLSFDQLVEKFKSTVVEHPVPQYGEWTSNITELQEPSVHTGSFVAYLDLDGYVRRYPLFYRSGNRLGTSYIPSLGLQTYLAATGYRAEVTIGTLKDKKAISSFQIINPQTEPETLVSNLPVDSQGRLLINYYGSQHSLPYVSAKDLFSGIDQVNVMIGDGTNHIGQTLVRSDRVNKKDFFKNKAVILGVTSIGVYDLRNTPKAANFPGPEIHTTVLANLFERSFLKKVNNEEVVIPLVVLILGAILSFILTWVGAFSAIICLVVALATCFFVDDYVFSHLHYVASSLFVFVSIFAVHFSMLFYKYFSEERKRGALKKTFSKYVSPAVVDELLKNEDNLKLGGRKEEMSVFFSDVRGFTQFSEKMDPQDLSKFLSEYLTPMTEIIFNNKGTLDKYMGDGVMAFFGAPVPYKDHAYHACKCALESIEALKKIQADFDKRNWPKVDIGIGINTGFMSVGNMGSKIVQSYTVIGDAVNLGSRLEGATKEYGTRILMSEATYEAVKNSFITREVDRVRVKGKKEPIRAYELIAMSGGSYHQQWLELYTAAYALYHARDFSKAQEAFAHIETLFPHDTLSKIYKDRCIQFIVSPPPPNWDGVFEMRTK